MVTTTSPIIRTDRLILRAPTMADLEKFQIAKEDVWDELQQWMSWSSDDQKSLSASEEFIKNNTGLNTNGDAILLGFDRITNDFVIASGFNKLEEGVYFTGYWVAKDYRRKGYAYEATQAILRYVFNGLNAKAMRIDHFDRNEASANLIRKLGFDYVDSKNEMYTQFSTGRKIAGHNYVLNNLDKLEHGNSIWIRPFRKDEWQDLKAKRLQALKEMSHLFLSTYGAAAAQRDEFWQDMIGAEKSEVFGLFDNGKLIGITGVLENWRDPSGKSVNMGMSYIDPEYRGQGLSQLLYQIRIDWAQAKGFEKITVSHREGNEASKAANQKFGFVFYEKEEIDFPDGKAMDYRYELKL